MTMAVNNQQNEPPHEGLMRISYEGLYWAGNICQTVEKICAESNIVKNSYKYVDAVGEHLKNIFDAVVNDFDNPDDDDPVLSSDVSLGSDVPLKSFEKEGAKFDEIASDIKLSSCGDRELATYCVEDLSLKQDNAINITKMSATIPKFTCNKVEKTVYSDDGSVLKDGTIIKISTFDHVEDFQAKLPNKSVSLIEKDDYTDKCKTAQDGRLCLSVSSETSHGDVLHRTVFAADWTDSVRLSSQSLSSISHQAIFTGEQSSCQSDCVDSNPQETLCILESGESEYALKKGHERTGTCVVSPKCACQEILSSFSREEDQRNHFVFSMENDDMNEFKDATLDNDFEELKIDDCRDDILKHKIDENSSLKNKRISYKELLAKEKAQTSQAATDEVDLDELMDDPELEKLHADRIAALKKEAEKREVLKRQGHGEYRDITEADFLSEVTGSENVICHFYHREFYRCKIMDKHLKTLAPVHVDTKFIRLDAENAPFFVKKLAIKALPCVILFRDGIAFDRLVGFQDIGCKDDFTTRALEQLLMKKSIICERKGEGDDEERDSGKSRSIRTSMSLGSDSD